MEDLRRKLKRIPLALLLAIAVAVGASVIMVVQIYVVPPPSAIVAPVDTGPTALTSGTYTVVFSISIYYGQTALHSNLAALGLVSLQANTTGWYYQVNDWLYTVVRRNTGSTTFTLPTGTTIDVYEYNSTNALVVNRARNTAFITRMVSVGTTGWYAYHPVYTSYDSTTRNALISYMSSKGLTQLYVFQPKRDYIVFDPTTKTFRVYFDVVTSTGSITTKGSYLSNTTNFVPLAPDTAVVPPDTQYIITANDVVLAPVWVLLMLKPSSSINSALTVTPQVPSQPPPQ